MRKRLFISFVALLFLFQATAGVQAVAPSAKIGASASVSLTNVNLVPGDQYQILSYDLKYTNNGNSALDLLDYWTRVVSNQGNRYSVQIHPDDKSLSSVAPKSSLTVRYYAKIGADESLGQLKINVIQFDFSASNYERTIGSFSLTENISVVKSNTSKLIEIKGTPVYSKVKEYTALEGSDGGESSVQATFVFFNNGRRTITLPEYKFLLKTRNGILYPLEAVSSDEGNHVNPKSYKEYQLTGTIPAGVSVKGAQLLLVQEIDSNSGKIELAAGTYELVNGTGSSENAPATAKLGLKTSEGEYEIETASIQRSPWDLKDVLSVRLKVTNKADEIVPIPNLAGEIKLDNGTYLKLTPIANEYASELGPGDETSVFMVAKVPSGAKYKTATIRLKHQVSDTQTVNIGQLKAELNQSTPAITTDQPYSTDTYGLHTTYRILRSGVYEGIYNDLYLVQIEIRNDDVRNRNLLSIAGLFKTLDGQQFTAQVTEISGQQNARTSRVVNVWTEIPKDLDTSGMRLYFGEAVSGGKLLAENGNAEAIIQPVQYRLPDSDVAPVTSKNIEVAPFKLDILTFYPVYDQGDLAQNVLTVKMKYRLTKDFAYTNGTEDRNYLVALEYARGKSTFEQKLSIGDEALDTTLALGEHELFLTKSYAKNFDFHLFDSYTLRIYEEFKGYKKLIAEKPFILYNLNDWSNE